PNQAVANAKLDSITEQQEEQLERGVRNEYLRLCVPAARRQAPTLPRQPISLVMWLACHQLTMKMTVHQPPGLAVERQVILDRRIPKHWHGVEGAKPALCQQRRSLEVLAAVDQHIEVGITRHAGEQVLIALPM